MKFSIIIPTYNAEKFIINCVKSIQRGFQNAEIIVADGGSVDGTIELLKGEDIIIVSSPKGRGIQLNQGAKRASGEILFFLHADTVVPFNISDVITKYFSDKRVKVAKCRLKFDQESLILSVYEKLARIDSIWTSFGDQGIVVRKDFFDTIGGFYNWPLLEDVSFFDKARKLGPVYTIPTQVITSAERFMRNGIVKQQCFNASIIFKYLCGVSVKQLALEYEYFLKKK